jgi:hypothetical protein
MPSNKQSYICNDSRSWFLPAMVLTRKRLFRKAFVASLGTAQLQVLRKNARGKKTWSDKIARPRSREELGNEGMNRGAMPTRAWACEVTGGMPGCPGGLSSIGRHAHAVVRAGTVPCPGRGHGTQTHTRARTRAHGVWRGDRYSAAAAGSTPSSRSRTRSAYSSDSSIPR